MNDNNDATTFLGQRDIGGIQGEVNAGLSLKLQVPGFVFAVSALEKYRSQLYIPVTDIHKYLRMSE